MAGAVPMAGPDRPIRVFVCWTDDDMERELALLRFYVIPRLRERLADAGIGQIVLVDGDDERAGPADARRLRDTLRAIDGCRPFFIGLVGERLGPPVGPLPPAMIAEYPHLADSADLPAALVQIEHAASWSAKESFVLVYRRDDALAEATAGTPGSHPASETSAHAAFFAAISAAGHRVDRYRTPQDAAGDQAFEELLFRDLETALRTFAATWREEATALSDEVAEESTIVMPAPQAAPMDRPRAIPPPAAAPPAPPSVGAPPRPAPAGDAVAPNPCDENVQFTVYRPRLMAPARWYPLLVFAHLSEKRPDAADTEPDPLEEVARQAAGVLGAERDAYQEVVQDSLAAVPQEGEITFAPRAEGIEFNPPSRTFRWQEAVHREEFRMRATAPGNRTITGTVTVFLGHILLAEIPLRLRVSDEGERSPVELAGASARAYRKLFPSYSHKDEAIVVQFERFAAALGDDYLRDVTTLRSGEVWNERLEALVREADVFQLFWSSNSMRSQYVRSEWEYALGLGRPSFVRPVYWEEPLPADPAAGLPPETLARLHFHRFAVATMPPGAAGTGRRLSDRLRDRPGPRDVGGGAGLGGGLASDAGAPTALEADAFRRAVEKFRAAEARAAEAHRAAEARRAERPEARERPLDVRSPGDEAGTVRHERARRRRWDQVVLRSPPMRAPRRVRWLSRVVPGIAAAALLCLVVLNVYKPANKAHPPPPPPATARRIDLPSIAFDGSAATIDPGDSERLDAIVETLRERPTLSVVLEGHTDALEDRPDDLARRRAESVRRSLIERGVSADRLSVESHGSSEPVASNDTPAGRASNRRVEVIVR